MKRSVLWGAAGVLVALALFAFIVPRANADSELRSFTDDVPEVAAALELSDERNQRVRSLRMALVRVTALEIAKALPPSASAGLTVTAGPGVSDDLRRVFAEKANAEFAALNGSTKTPLHAHLALLEESAGLERYHVLPRSAGDPCTTVIVVDSYGNRRWPQWNPTVLGTCLFYARYGMPGTGMQAWLDSTRGVFAATDSVMTAPRPDSALSRIDWSDVIYTPVEASCAAGNFAVCATLFAHRQSRFTRSFFVDDVHLDATPNVVRGGNVLFGPGTHLALLRDALGNTDFAQVWESTTDPIAAFEAVDGRPIGALLHDELLKQVRPHHPGALGARFQLVLGLLVGLAFTAIGVRFTPRLWR